MRVGQLIIVALAFWVGAFVYVLVTVPNDQGTGTTIRALVGLAPVFCSIAFILATLLASIFRDMGNPWNAGPMIGRRRVRKSVHVDQLLVAREAYAEGHLSLDGLTRQVDHILRSEQRART